MKTYTFDVKLFATFHVTAPDEQTARRMINDLNGNEGNFGAWPDGSPALATFEADGEHDLIELDPDADETPDEMEGQPHD